MTASRRFWQTKDAATVLSLMELWVRQGMSEAEMARRFGVSADTFRRWKHTRPDLQAVLAGREKRLSQMDARLALTMPAKLSEVRARVEAGAGAAELCAWLDIGRTTFYRWQQKYPAFGAAVRAGRPRSRLRQSWDGLAMPEKLPLVKEWAAAGVPLQEIAGRLGISLQTLTAWRTRRPELRAALNRAGRPVKSKGKWEEKAMSEKLKQVEKWAEAGAPDAEIARLLGVSPSTVKRWKQARPEFAGAIAAGRVISDAEVAACALRQVNGYTYVEERICKVREGDTERIEVIPVLKYARPSASMTQFILRHHLPERYGDRSKPDEPKEEPFVFELWLEKYLAEQEAKRKLRRGEDQGR